MEMNNYNYNYIRCCSHKLHQTGDSVNERSIGNVHYWLLVSIYIIEKACIQDLLLICFDGSRPVEVEVEQVQDDDASKALLPFQPLKMPSGP